MNIYILQSKEDFTGNTKLLGVYTQQSYAVAEAYELALTMPSDYDVTVNKATTGCLMEQDMELVCWLRGLVTFDNDPDEEDEPTPSTFGDLLKTAAEI